MVGDPDHPILAGPLLPCGTDSSQGPHIRATHVTALMGLCYRIWWARGDWQFPEDGGGFPEAQALASALAPATVTNRD